MQRQFLLDRVCCTGLPTYQYAAQGLQICSAQSLQMCSAQNQIKQECDAQRLHICSAQGLQICFAPCLKICCVYNPQMPIQMLHTVCKHNMHCTGPTNILHLRLQICCTGRRRLYFTQKPQICTARSLQICCTGPAKICCAGPANMRRRCANMTHMQGLVHNVSANEKGLDTD